MLFQHTPSAPHHHSDFWGLSHSFQTDTQIFFQTQMVHAFTEDFHCTSHVSFLPWDDPRSGFWGSFHPVWIHVHQQFSSEGVCTVDASACLLCFVLHWEAVLNPLKCIFFVKVTKTANSQPLQTTTTLQKAYSGDDIAPTPALFSPNLSLGCCSCWCKDM